VGPRNGETSRRQGPSGTKPSRRDFDCFRLIQRFSKLHLGCILLQSTIATLLGVKAVSTVERRIRKLKAMGAIEVTHRGPTSSVYSVLWKDCDTWQSFLKLAAENEGASKRSTNQTVTAESEGASEGAFEGASGIASITELPSEDGTASLAECARTPEPASQRKSVNQETLADFIREETRFLIGGKVADENTVQRLASIVGSMEVYNILRVKFREWRRNNTPRSWGIMVELARDAAISSTRERQGQTHPVGAPRFVKEVETRPIAQAAEAADRENKAILQQLEHERQHKQEFIETARAHGWQLVHHSSNCSSCYGFGQRDTGKICECDAGRQFERARTWCGRCENTGIVCAAEDPVLSAWCDCVHATHRQEREPDAVESGNHAVMLLRSSTRSQFGRRSNREETHRVPAARAETTVPTVTAIHHQISALAAQKGFGGASRRA